ncbi:MAG: FUN14 domain-containing protein [Planctomycetota bacterium]
MGDEQKPGEKKKKKERQPPKTAGQILAEMPAWKKTLLVVSGVVVIICMAMQITASSSRPDDVPSAREASRSTIRAFQPNTLVAIDPDNPGETVEIVTDAPDPKEQLDEAGEMDVWSLGALRLSFSFFVGLAVAHFLRALMRATLIGAGFLIMGLLVLQYAGFIDVKWDVVEARYETFGAWAADQFTSLRVFATGYLPSVGGAMAGAVLGFKRR